MIGPCAGGCGATVCERQCFCKGCQWTIRRQYADSITRRCVTHGYTVIVPTSGDIETMRQPKIGFTTDPYFQMAGA